MEVKLKPANKNGYPIGGFFIRNRSVRHWMILIQQLNIGLNEVVIVPLPGKEANEIWGCLVITSHSNKENVMAVEFAQQVSPNCFIPVFSKLDPVLTPYDMNKLSREFIHVFHPEIGLVEGKAIRDYSALLAAPKEKFIYCFEPAKGVTIPTDLKSFQIKPVEGEDPIEKLEKEVIGEKKSLEKKPLSGGEKLKLFAFKRLFKPRNKSGSTTDEGGGITPGGFEPGALMKGFGALAGLFGGGAKWMSNKQQEFEDLEERNKRAMDRLMKMLRDNPEEGLKYAIPLDESGSGRGERKGLFDMQRRWGNFSLFGNLGLFGNSSGGGSVDIGDDFARLRQQYMKNAQDLVNKKEYKKAAFIYLKLLKNYHAAAETLEQGAYYNDAAEVYLKFANNTSKAADCFEKGKMYERAIELYEKLHRHEKVGDLYQKIGRRKKALTYYHHVASESKEKRKFLEAFRVYKEKIGDHEEGKNALFEGWIKGPEKSQCLSKYFEEIPDVEEKGDRIIGIYQDDLAADAEDIYLNVILNVRSKHPELEDQIAELGYEIIAEKSHRFPDLLDKLTRLKPTDGKLGKDVMRYKMKKNLLGKKRTRR